MNRDLLKENRVHGNPMYPVSIYPNVEQLNGQSILDCHWHDEMEFIVVRQGSATFQINMSYYEVNAGEAIFVNSGELHAGYVERDHGVPCIFSAVVFSPDLLLSHAFDIVQEKFIDPLLKKQLLPPPHIKRTESWEIDILHYLDIILTENENKAPTCELTTKAHLYLILANMANHMQQSTRSNPNPIGSHEKVERIKIVLNYIHDHYPESLKLKDLASEINMSEGHFCRFFKQMVQKTPIDYMNNYRIQKACKLLENSDKKIVDIAMDVGFDNLSYFITVFKNHKNCTPSAYKKQFYEGLNIQAEGTDILTIHRM
ncbi:AraC family transcriptional regulator [Paenibacillus crassostreae]|uniref:AraC family transcriptional regulator n=1 Tax=Paenibacillus crassostreae TaxID=1763538 RepID=A0A167FSK3_9BACL|nr:AraC family transcriptional regulator [Paenibacillus crassostreae]AOZ94105.1 AraC family transcriptional regulator [Paenibacillus crassostreae]OAB76859.1 AraC family transcriptional regulator [Paenibacillus crassostreae]